jgi:tetratricopeptide (TPR) repeat protein
MNAPEVSRLLEDGLSHFGVGEVGRAVECWERVLRLDPGNAIARDYLENARAGAAEAPRPPVEALLGDARELVRRDQLEEALDHFELATRLDPERIEAELYVDLLRAKLLQRYRGRIGPSDTRPQLRLDSERIARFNLSAGAGFLLSRLDGATSVGELVALSGMDAFEAFRILNRLLDAGIIGVAAA